MDTGEIFLTKIDASGTSADERINVTDAAMTTAGQTIVCPIDGLDAIEIKKIEGTYNNQSVNISLSYFQKL